jgi:Flp pilus assembly protein TadG
MRRGESGAAIIEFAIAAVVFFAMIFGVMEIGLALYSFHFISEAAREGARYARVRGSACVSDGTYCTATAAQIQTYVQGLSYPGIDPSHLTVTPTYAGYPAGTACTPSASCNNPGNLVTVKVTYSFPLSLPFVSSNTLSMSSSSSMILSQ